MAMYCHCGETYGNCEHYEQDRRRFTVQITVNGKSLQFDREEISYAQLVALAGFEHGKIYTATYRNKNKQGSVRPEDVVILEKKITPTSTLWTRRELSYQESARV